MASFLSSIRRRRLRNDDRKWPSSRRLRCRPRVEALESYLLLATFMVNSTGDQTDPFMEDFSPDVDLLAPGEQVTLRSAIQNANFFFGLDAIRFAIGSGPQSIQPTSELPALTD